MSRPISSIRNLGPASEAAFARADIHTADEIEAIGADEAYLRLLQSGSAPHFIGYYVLVMGLQGRPWNDCKGKEKEALRVRFDALKARAATIPSASKDHRKLEMIFDELGLLARR